MANPYQGPFEVGGGDGSDYFTILPPEPLLIDAFLTLERARVEALKHPDRVEARARAGAISLVISQVGQQVEAAAILTAEQAETMIEARINSTQKRPDSPGNSPGRRLKDGIVCRAVKTAIPGGAVGIGDLSTLKQVADAQGREYWRAQEFGSHHLVGRTLLGLFQPGDSVPDMGQFRQHPIFEPRGDGGVMRVRNPIPERAFLRGGAAAAEVFRQRALGGAVTGGIRELRAITAGVSARLPGLRRIVR